MVSIEELYTSVASLPSTTTAVTSGSEALVTSGGVHAKLADYALSSDLPAITNALTGDLAMPLWQVAVLRRN